jgi:tetratricopeptide (TPR) repeat protein
MIRNIILEGRWFSENEMGIIVEYENMLIGQREKISQYLLNYSAFIENTEYKEFLEDFKWSDPVYNAKIQEVRMFYAQGKYEDQLKSARELLSLSNDDQERAVSHYWQGLAYYNLRNTTAARTNLLESIKLDENFAGPYVTLSAISLTEGNFQQSLTYALKCAELDPEYGWCYNNIGLTFAYLGDKTNAILNLERAVELDPDSYLFADNLKRVRAGL